MSTPGVAGQSGLAEPLLADSGSGNAASTGGGTTSGTTAATLRQGAQFTKSSFANGVYLLQVVICMLVLDKIGMHHFVAHCGPAISLAGILVGQVSTALILSMKLDVESNHLS